MTHASDRPSRPSGRPSGHPSDHPSDPPGSEQRSHRRRGFITFAWYKCIAAAAADADADADPTLEGLARSCDISEQGVGLITARALPEGAAVFIEIASKVGGLSLVARVKNCRTESDGRHRVGLSIEVVPPTDRGTLSKILGP
ncbi:MAG: PilZ domain-containing protein [Myxococcales bacterium]|nr:PilZ domain-containing protein [Myxococcales bacterium]